MCLLCLYWSCCCTPSSRSSSYKFIKSNSLTLTTVSSQLSNISEQVRGLNSSLLVIKDNLDIGDQLDRKREQEKAKREAILAEQGLREGKESELEKKIQFALLTPEEGCQDLLKVF